MERITIHAEKDELIPALLVGSEEHERGEILSLHVIAPGEDFINLDEEGIDALMKFVLPLWLRARLRGSREFLETLENFGSAAGLSKEESEGFAHEALRAIEAWNASL